VRVRDTTTLTASQVRGRHRILVIRPVAALTGLLFVAVSANSAVLAASRGLLHSQVRYAQF
jgi:hypothetical protein